MARRSMPSLNALRALEAFARHGRMTLAADELCVTHGAVSRQIRQLEVQLGLSLVEGPRNRPRLTLEAAQLASALTQAFDLIEQATPRPEPAGERLLVSCIGTFAMKWLIPRLPGFLRRRPGVEVRITEGFELPDFGPEGVDVAIRIHNVTFPADMMATSFLPNFFGPVAAPELLAAGSPAKAALALPRLHTRTRMEAWREWSALTGVPLGRAEASHVFEHNSYMLEAALAGLGVAVTPWPIVAQDVAAGRLVAPFGFVAKPGDHVLVRPRARTCRAADWFEAWLVEEGARTPPPPDVAARAGL